VTKFPMARIALAEVRVNPRRLIAVVVAIAVSVAYLTASVSIVASESATMDRIVIARTSKADVVVTLTRADSGLVERVRQVRGVGSADLSYLSRGRVTGSSEWVQQQSVPDNPALRWTDVIEGEWPAAPDEIVLGTLSAKQLNTRVGDELTINDGNSSTTLRVTGLTREGGSLLAGLAQSSFVAPSFYTGAESIRSSLQTEVLVIGDDTSTPDELAGRIEAVAAGNSVETSSAFAQRKISEQTSGVFVFELMLLVFGAIALLVGGITIVNTFLILVAQRRRQIGLLRALGTATGQIRRALLVEAAAVGLAGSVLGVLIGVAVSGIVATALDEVLTVPFGQVLASAAAGVLLAVVAVLAPARRATRIVPLEALRPVADRETERRQSRLRLVVAASLLVSGGAAIASGFGASPYALLMSVGGLMVCATGLLVAVGFYLPFLLRLGRRLVAGLGPAARLAANNSVRDPGRAAATGAALILAVGIVVTLQVGAASMKATANGNLDSRFPIDVTVSVFDGALPARAAADIAAVPGIVAVKGLKSTRGQVRLGGTTKNLRVLAAEDVGDDEVFADPYLLRDFPAGETTIVGRTSTITRPATRSLRRTR
jgi:putative ABC transport system permease protein